MPKTWFRQTISAPGLLRLVRDCFDRIEDPIAPVDFQDDRLIFGFSFLSASGMQVG